MINLIQKNLSKKSCPQISDVKKHYPEELSKKIYSNKRHFISHKLRYARLYQRNDAYAT